MSDTRFTTKKLMFFQRALVPLEEAYRKQFNDDHFLYALNESERASDMLSNILKEIDGASQ